jgi:hypothetical protein
MHRSEEPVVRERREVFLAFVVVTFQPIHWDWLIQWLRGPRERRLYCSNEGGSGKRVKVIALSNTCTGFRSCPARLSNRKSGWMCMRRSANG